MTSSLFRVSSPGLIWRPVDNYSVRGVLEDGSVVIHAAPGTPIPDDALEIYRNGESAWTWDEIAAEQSHEWCAQVEPHDWAGEETALTLDNTLWAY